MISPFPLPASAEYLRLHDARVRAEAKLAAEKRSKVVCWQTMQEEKAARLALARFVAKAHEVSA